MQHHVKSYECVTETPNKTNTWSCLNNLQKMIIKIVSAW